MFLDLFKALNPPVVCNTYRSEIRNEGHTCDDAAWMRGRQREKKKKKVRESISGDPRSTPGDGFPEIS
jgi:hypothetical protein